MNEPLFGQIIMDGTPDGRRDAVHVATVAMVASCELKPGQHVGADGRPGRITVGIVDPFLRLPVKPGQRYWLWLAPRTVTSLRHQWTHPAFDAAGKLLWADEEDLPLAEECDAL